MRIPNFYLTYETSIVILQLKSNILNYYTVFCFPSQRFLLCLSFLQISIRRRSDETLYKHGRSKLPLLTLPGGNVAKCKLSIRQVGQGNVLQVLDLQPLTNGIPCEVAWVHCLKAFAKWHATKLQLKSAKTTQHKTEREREREKNGYWRLEREREIERSPLCGAGVPLCRRFDWLKGSITDCLSVACRRFFCSERV